MSDLISREKAIDAVNAWLLLKSLNRTMSNVTSIQDVLRQLPSAQPEIIHCKDCKNSEHWYRDRRRCFLWAEAGVSVFDDGFCSYAERRKGS